MAFPPLIGRIANIPQHLDEDQIRDACNPHICLRGGYCRRMEFIGSLAMAVSEWCSGLRHSSTWLGKQEDMSALAAALIE